MKTATEKIMDTQGKIIATQNQLIGALEGQSADERRQLQTAHEVIARQKKHIRELTKALKAAQEAAPESARLKAAKEQVVATGKALETARYQLGRVACALLGRKPAH